MGKYEKFKVRLDPHADYGKQVLPALRKLNWEVSRLWWLKEMKRALTALTKRHIQAQTLFWDSYFTLSLMKLNYRVQSESCGQRCGRRPSSLGSCSSGMRTNKSDLHSESVPVIPRCRGVETPFSFQEKALLSHFHPVNSSFLNGLPR